MYRCKGIVAGILSVFMAVVSVGDSFARSQGSLLEVCFGDVAEPEKAGVKPFDPAGCDVLIDEGDSPVVKKVAGMFAADVSRVTGVETGVVYAPGRNSKAVIIGTIGQSCYIDALVRKGVLDVSSITGEWERYRIINIENPLPGISDALVIAGSDRRGAAYGSFSVSESMGVSPWEWWADVPVKRRDNVRIYADYLSEAPSVKYRGIFINDEDWGLLPWAAGNYEKELGDIGPRTYERVCELLLRLKGNMLAPAMHACTGAFYSHPESKAVVDSCGIIITTSHCEPMLFNNAAKSEWDTGRDGEWNYVTNKAVIYSKMDARVKESAQYENIYTMAMRGVHDEGMRGDLSMERRIEVLGEVIKDQRGILEKRLGRSASEVPQIFVPYKETLDVYEAGLDIPDDITLVWPDDNYGYWKHLNDSVERSRRGGSGVYYHTSYLGTPHDYLWLCTTPPVLMYEELKKAYDYGADRYWLLNVGDIKPMEMAIQTFFEMAWDVEAFDIRSVNAHQPSMLAGIFGDELLPRFQRLLDEYYRLAWSRKPEYMGWEYEWDAPHLEQLGPTDFSFDNYNDARGRLDDYRNISDEISMIMSELPDSLKAPLFEMIGYPVMAAYQMNRKFLMAQLNAEYRDKGDYARANWAGEQSRMAYDSINALNNRYNSLLGGKWSGMMSVPPGFVAKYQNMPDIVITDNVASVKADIEPESEQRSMEGCCVVDIASPVYKSERINVIDGLGFDWSVVQLGEDSPGADPSGAVAVYELPEISCDTIEVTVYALPLFPLNDGCDTRYGVSVDSEDMITVSYHPVEWSSEWKANVLRNSTVNKFRFKIDPRKKTHTLKLHAIDAGQMIQRVVVDWGGLRDSYVGPSVNL